MNLKNFYWYFENPFPDSFINKILKQGNKNKKRLAITGAQGRNRNLTKHPLSKEEIKQLKKQRNSKINWLQETWIYEKINPVVHAANHNAGWNFQWDWNEEAQFTEYKKGQFYDWHMDSWPDSYPSTLKKFGGKIRKLSSILLLSESGKDFEGGELEMDFTNGGSSGKRIITEINKKGSFIVFPSFVKHRVTPVTKGVRYSMPMWHLGKPWQ
tara:strand:- start:3015 stop:3650 length:636 start_codon:yes stop_codon:yes gene_type:complete